MNAITDRIKARTFHLAGGTEDWRVVGEGACTCFRTDSLAAAARFAQAVAELPGGSPGRPDLDLRADGVTVRLITVGDGYYGLTERDVELAREISALAGRMGLTADPAVVQTVQVTVDALVTAECLPFWRAVLDYRDRGDSEEDLLDPRRRGAPFYFQAMAEPRPQRNRLHVDVWVPHDGAGARIAAALAAGGTLVSDAHAPGHWVLADPEGNEVCVGVAGWPGPDAGVS
ncbi:VOC family protein [Kitasatospora viridis]|nr:VOC family protein [Kitasatospora viridis]